MVSSYRGGPLGLGDPENNFISELERSTVLAKFIRDKLFTELCQEEWKQWRSCIRQNNNKWFTALRCKNIFGLVNKCQLRYVTDSDEFKKLEDEYISKRSEYRRCGTPVKFLSGPDIRKITEDEAKLDNL